ncbi:MAG TPA: amino acid adenylation domain-containing protein [Pyrinomonadaceae bacterium]|nr:amino acid adenylation domain-containing protein [Pyrinomonadaceae bacterium]
MSGSERQLLLELMLRSKRSEQSRPRRLGLTSAPLSFAQQRLWILDQMNPGDPSYNIAAAVKIEGPLQVAVLQRALEEIVRRHEVLRTTFQTIDSEPVQLISNDNSVALSIVNVEEETEARRLLRELGMAPFDLANGPLLRVTLLKFSDELHWLVLVVHHIVFDGVSRSIFIRELTSLYEAFANDAPSPLEDVALQYADYAVWQRDALQGEAFEKHIARWQEALGEQAPSLRILTDHPRRSGQTLRGAREARPLPPALLDSLEQLARSENASLFMILMAAFKVLLWRYTGQREIIVGAPVANREMVETENSIGFFINALALRSEPEPNLTFREFLKQVRAMALDAFNHQHVPFEKLVEALRLDRHSTHAPLFQVAFSIKQAPMRETRCADLKISPLELEAGAVKLDLALSLTDNVVTVDYNADLFEPSTCKSMLERFQNLLAAIVADADRKIRSLPLMSLDHLCHEQFEAHAASQPNAVAVVYENEHMTYGELNRKANQVAHYLRARGVTAETPVAVCLKRSLNIAIALLGVLKSGGVYLPLDPSYFGERGEFILQDSQAQIVLTDTEFPDQPTTNPGPLATPANAAYIIYTSGTTGRPKGVVVEHRGLYNVVTQTVAAFNIAPANRVLQFASISFDASIWQTFMALQAGAELFLASDEDRRSGIGLVTLLQQAKIEIADLPPSLLSVLPADEIPDLRTISTGGERVPGEVSDTWSPGRSFFNVYGPTETSVAVSMMKCERSYPQGPPIGRAIPNTQLYVLDENGELSPPGCPGELYIGGAGVARGYLGHPELTAASFVPNPFSSTPGARLYKTGDSCRVLLDGNIEFIGRRDQQIKIRGFRIELNEIEAALQRHPDVEEAAVVCDNDQLAAYVVLHSDPDPNIRSFLRTQLPEYMIPHAIVPVDRLPRNISGKLDRAALPPIASAAEETTDAPQTPMSVEIVRIWANLLKLDPAHIGIHQSFFKLGGHSLLAIQLLFQIKRTFDVEIPFVDLFQDPTVAGLELAIVQRKLELVETSELDELLADVEQMTDEDVDQLLTN